MTNTFGLKFTIIENVLKNNDFQDFTIRYCQMIKIPVSHVLYHFSQTLKEYTGSASNNQNALSVQVS